MTQQLHFKLCLEKCEHKMHQRYVQEYSEVALFIVAENWKHSKCSSMEWINNVVHSHNGLLYNNKGEWLLPHATTWMNLIIKHEGS